MKLLWLAMALGLGAPVAAQTPVRDSVIYYDSVWVHPDTAGPLSSGAVPLPARDSTLLIYTRIVYRYPAEPRTMASDTLLERHLLGTWAVRERATDVGERWAVIRFAEGGTYQSTVRFVDDTGPRPYPTLTGTWTIVRPPGLPPALCVRSTTDERACQAIHFEEEVLFWGEFSFGRVNDAVLEQLRISFE